MLTFSVFGEQKLAFGVEDNKVLSFLNFKSES